MGCGSFRAPPRLQQARMPASTPGPETRSLAPAPHDKTRSRQHFFAILASLQVLKPGLWHLRHKLRTDPLAVFARLACPSPLQVLKPGLWYMRNMLRPDHVKPSQGWRAPPLQVPKPCLWHLRQMLRPHLVSLLHKAHIRLQSRSRNQVFGTCAT